MDAEHIKKMREARKTAPRTPTAVRHTVRTRDGGQKTIKCGRTLAIKLMCMECLGWEGDPQECTSPLCPVYPFRGVTLKSQRGE